MPVGADQGNWMASCRSAPVSPGTWTASPGCVPPPTAGLDRSSRPIGPISPRKYAGPIRRTCGWYPASATVPWPVELSYPLSRHRFWTPSGRSTTMLSSVGLRSFVSWTLAPATTTLSGPPAPSTKMLFLLPALPRSVGLRPIAPPQNVLSPSSSQLTAIPSLRRPTPGILLSGRPRHVPAPRPLPIAGRSGGWCCHPPAPWASGSIGRSYAYGR